MGTRRGPRPPGSALFLGPESACLTRVDKARRLAEQQLVERCVPGDVALAARDAVGGQEPADVALVGG